MGIDTDSKLLVGCSYGELEAFFEAKELEGLDIYEVIEEYFEYMSPWYDSEPEYWFIGFKIPNHQPVTKEWFDEVQEACHQFQLLTGVKARIKGGAHVW